VKGLSSFIQLSGVLTDSLTPVVLLLFIGAVPVVFTHFS